MCIHALGLSAATRLAANKTDIWLCAFFFSEARLWDSLRLSATNRPIADPLWSAIPPWDRLAPNSELRTYRWEASVSRKSNHWNFLKTHWLCVQKGVCTNVQIRFQQQFEHVPEKCIFQADHQRLKMAQRNLRHWMAQRNLRQRGMIAECSLPGTHKSMTKRVEASNPGPSRETVLYMCIMCVCIHKLPSYLRWTDVTAQLQSWPLNLHLLRTSRVRHELVLRSRLLSNPLRAAGCSCWTSPARKGISQLQYVTTSR